MRRCFVAIVVSIATTAVAIAPASAVTGPRPCAVVTDQDQRAAIAAADAWRAARWVAAGRGWVTAYVVKGAPPSPLGIDTFARSKEFNGGPGPAQPVSGLAAVANFACSTYELTPHSIFVVRFTGDGLTFSENGGPWSNPLRRSLVHVLEVRHGTGATPTWDVREMDGSRSALMPGAQLAPPASGGTARPITTPYTGHGKGQAPGPAGKAASGGAKRR
jgi:hypothetical protein